MVNKTYQKCRRSVFNVADFGCHCESIILFTVSQISIVSDYSVVLHTSIHFSLHVVIR